MEHIKYIAMSLGTNGGVQGASSSGLKDTLDEVEKWAFDLLKKPNTWNVNKVAIFAAMKVVERTESPVRSRFLPHPPNVQNDIDVNLTVQGDAKVSYSSSTPEVKPFDAEEVRRSKLYDHA